MAFGVQRSHMAPRKRHQQVVGRVFWKCRGPSGRWRMRVAANDVGVPHLFGDDVLAARRTGLPKGPPSGCARASGPPDQAERPCARAASGIPRQPAEPARPSSPLQTTSGLTSMLHPALMKPPLHVHERQALMVAMPPRPTIANGAFNGASCPGPRRGSVDGDEQRPSQVRTMMSLSSR